MPNSLQEYLIDKCTIPGATSGDGDDSDDSDDSDSDNEDDTSSKLNDIINEQFKNNKIKGFKRGDIEYKDGSIYIDIFVMKYLFGTVLNPLLDHVDSKVLTHKNVKDCETIFLAGGLSSSPYVTNVLREHYVKEKKMNMWSIDLPFVAVVRGAVNFGLNPSTIVEYYTEYSYGIKICRDYDAKIDDDDRKVWTDEGHVVFNVFKRLVKRGPININDPDPAQYFAPLDSKDKKIEISVYRVKADDIAYTHDKNGKLLSNVEALNDGQMFDLPLDWDATKSFPIRFDFKKDIRAEVGLKNYPEAERFIELHCKLSADK